MVESRLRTLIRLPRCSQADNERFCTRQTHKQRRPHRFALRDYCRRLRGRLARFFIVTDASKNSTKSSVVFTNPLEITKIRLQVAGEIKTVEVGERQLRVFV